MESRNPLERWPNLFTNGKFRVKVSTGEKEHQKLKPRRIIGIRRKLRDWIITETLETKKEGSFEVKYCTLIARKIEDMTDEEFNEWEERKYAPDQKDPYLSSPYSMIYLLSISVYPFDQSHFKDGTVININEV